MADQEGSTSRRPSSQVRRTPGGEKSDTSHRSQGAASAGGSGPGTVRTRTAGLLGAEASAARSPVTLWAGGIGRSRAAGGRWAPPPGVPWWKEVARGLPAVVWGAGGPRLPCLSSPGAALTVFSLCRQSHRGLQAGATQRAGDGRPLGPRGPGQGQVAAPAPGAVGVLCGRLLLVPALGLPGHLPGQAGRLQVAPHRQAGEVGLTLEPQVLQGRAQQVDPGGLGVVPALCRGQAQVDRVRAGPWRGGWERGRGVASGSWFL